MITDGEAMLSGTGSHVVVLELDILCQIFWHLSNVISFLYFIKSIHFEGLFCL